MATPAQKSEGEYIEIYNDSPEAASLIGLWIDDGDRSDRLLLRRGPELLEAYGYALIVDPDFPEDRLPAELSLPIYSVADHAIGNGLSASDPITLRRGDGLVLDSVAPLASGSDFARERLAPWLLDTDSAWRLRKGGSPGRRNMNAPSEKLKLHLTHDWDEEETIEALVNFIQASERSLDCAIYQMNHPRVIEALLNAFERGVALRIVTDTTFFDRADYFAAYQPLLLAGVPIVPDQRSSEQHNKFLVADAKRIWLGSYNPTTNPSADSALEFESEGMAAELIREVEEMMGGRFGVSRSQTTQSVHEVDGARITLLASPVDGVADALVKAISQAKHSIHFLAFSMTADAIGDAMLERAAVGVELHGAIDWLHASRGGSELPKFLDAGLDVRRSPHAMLMHQKLIVIDGGYEDAKLILGSYNFTERAETRNDETMLIIEDARLAAAAEAAIAAIMADSDAMGISETPSLRLTELSRGAQSWVEIENYGATTLSLAGLSLSNLESASALPAASLAPFERGVFPFASSFGESDPVLLTSERAGVIDAVASPLAFHSSRDTLTRVGPVSWVQAPASPGR